MAICRTYGKPDIFLTMTANPNWPEIQEELLWEVDPAPGANHQRRRQKASDCPDIVAHVFELKKNALLKEIKDGCQNQGCGIPKEGSTTYSCSYLAASR